MVNIPQKNNSFQKNSFRLYHIWSSEIQDLSDNQAGILLKSLFKYAEDQKKDPPKNQPHIRFLYSQIVNKMHSDWSMVNPNTGRSHWNNTGIKPGTHPPKKNPNE